MYDETLMDAEERMEKAVEHLGQSFRGIRTGRASPALVEDIRADFYGSPTPLKHMASTTARVRPVSATVFVDSAGGGFPSEFLDFGEEGRPRSLNSYLRAHRRTEPDTSVADTSS